LQGTHLFIKGRHSTVVSSGEVLAIYSTVVSLAASLHGGQRRTSIQNGAPVGGRARAHSPMAAEVPSAAARLALEHSSHPKGSILIHHRGIWWAWREGPAVAATIVAPPRLAHFAASPAVMPRCREMCGRSPDQAEGPPPPARGRVCGRWQLSPMMRDGGVVLCSRSPTCLVVSPPPLSSHHTSIIARARRPPGCFRSKHHHHHKRRRTDPPRRPAAPPPAKRRVLNKV
jgi:hypothetical protein